VSQSPSAEDSPADATAESSEPSEAPVAANNEPAASGVAAESIEPNSADVGSEGELADDEAPATTEAGEDERSDQTGDAAKQPTS
jgi:hypothetical protein